MNGCVVYTDRLHLTVNPPHSLCLLTSCILQMFVLLLLLLLLLLFYLLSSSLSLSSFISCLFTVLFVCLFVVFLFLFLLLLVLYDLKLLPVFIAIFVIALVTLFSCSVRTLWTMNYELRLQFMWMTFVEDPWTVNDICIQWRQCVAYEAEQSTVTGW